MFLYIFSFLALVISLIACVITKINLIRKNNRGQKMAIAKDFLWLTGIVGGILFMGLAVFSYIKSGTTITGYLLLLFVWFCLFLVYGWFGMITLYDEESFTCGWLPLQRKRYTYEQLTGEKRTLNGYKLFVGKRSVSYDERMMMPYHNFILFASEKYKSIHGKKLPEDKSIPKWDIFNGHVEEPESFIFLFLMIIMIGFGCLAAALFETYDYTEIEETTYIVTKIDDYYTDENHLILKSSDLAGEFDIVRYEEFEEIIPILQKEIKEENNLHINYKPSDYKKNWYEVFRLQNEDGQLIISLEEKNEKDSEYAKFYVLMACVMLVIIFLFCITTTIVGRYPYKFSKRIRKAFFKDGYLR